MTRQSYSAARGFLGFLEVLGWIGVGLGALASVVGVSTGEGLGIAILAGIPGVIGGLITVAVIQIARAQIDTAENTAEATEILRRIEGTLSHSPRSAPAVHQVATAGPAAALSPSRQSWRDGRITLSRFNSYVVDDRSFVTLAEAEAYLDSIPATYSGTPLRGGRIAKTRFGRYVVGDQQFDNLTEAEAYVDSQPMTDQAGSIGSSAYPIGEVMKTYRGIPIYRTATGVSAGGVDYPNVIYAERAIDGKSG